MIDWYSVLLKYGINVPTTGQFVLHCPLHEDRHQSCSINVDKGVWICFAGCGQGNLKSFLHKLSGKSYKQLDEELEDVTWTLDFKFFDDMDLDIIPEVEITTPDGLGTIPSNHLIFKRGFTRDILDKWGCMCNSYGDLSIPVKNVEEKILGWISRRQNAIPKYLYSKGFLKSKCLFGMNHLKTSETIYLVEGALDAMWLDQHGFPSLAILGASVSKIQIQLLSALSPSEVVLSLDNDKAGQKGISKATLDMHDRFMLSYIKLPNQYKDVQEINNIETLNKIMKNKVLW